MVAAAGRGVPFATSVRKLGRVSRQIKELGDEVALHRSKCDKLQAELAGLQETNAKLNSENQVQHGQSRESGHGTSDG